VYCTPLHYAAWKNNVESLQLLIKYGANVNQSDEDGNTALMWATSEEVWKFLIQRGADINKENKDGLPLSGKTGRESPFEIRFGWFCRSEDIQTVVPIFRIKVL
jgi:ankyrin repeat protein